MLGASCSCLKCHLCGWCAESRLNAQEDIRGPLSELQLEVITDIQDQILDYRCIDLAQVNQDCVAVQSLDSPNIFCMFYFTCMTIDVAVSQLWRQSYINTQGVKFKGM